MKLLMIDISYLSLFNTSIYHHLILNISFFLYRFALVATIFVFGPASLPSQEHSPTFSNRVQ